MNIVIYTKSTGNIFELLSDDTKLNGLNSELSYGLYDVPEGATNISECVIKPFTITKDIISNIYTSVINIEQSERIMDAFDKYPTFAMALDTQNWEVARQRLAKAEIAGDITPDDYDLVSSRIPV